METRKAIRFNTVTAIICTALLLFAVMSSAFADETSTGSEQPSMNDVFAMSNGEIINNAENLISDADVIASIEQIRGSLDSLTDDEIDFLARMVKTGYVIEHPDEYQTFLDESSASVTGSTELSTLSNPGGDWSQGVGVYPTTKGKILVTADWVGTSGFGILPSGHAAIVKDETYAWSSFPAFASQGGNGLGLDYEVEGVQEEANDWYLEIRHKTCFGLDVIATNDAQEEAAADWCEEQEGAAYNWALFDIETRDELYCSQLVWAAFFDLYGIDLNTPEFTYVVDDYESGNIYYYNAVHPMELFNSPQTSLVYRQGTAETGWQLVNGQWYYIDVDGSSLTGIYVVDNNTYKFNAVGILQTGWVYFSEGKRYYDPGSGSSSFDVVMSTGLKQIGNNTYYFNSSGIMQTGWVTIGTWHYYFNDEGVRMPGYSWQESVPGSGGSGGFDATCGSINLETSSFIVETGKQINLFSNNYVYATGTNGDYHLDFGVANTNGYVEYGPNDGYISIDKHTGELTGLAVGTTMIYVFLEPSVAPFGNPSNPCYTPIDIETIEVTVICSTDYGFQGLDNALYMNFPAVDRWGYNATDGYVNSYDTPLVPDEDNNIHFEYTQLVGFDYILPTTYASNDYNGYNLKLIDSNGMIVRWFEWWPVSPEHSIIIAAYHPEYKTVELMINMDNLPPGNNYRLQFYGSFKGEDDDGYPRTLGAPVTFAFSF